MSLRFRRLFTVTLRATGSAPMKISLTAFDVAEARAVVARRYPDWEHYDCRASAGPTRDPLRG